MAKSTSSALAALLLLLAAPAARGHGWLEEPPARNAQKGERNGYCPHCGNGGGVCGDGGQWPAASNYLGGRNDGPQRTYTAGEVVEFAVQITAHHMGHFELHLCDEHVGPLTPDPEGESGCFNKYILERVRPEEVNVTNCTVNDPRDDCQPMDEFYPERWYLSPGPGEKKMHFRIPEGVQCDSCTLQWRWWTANSCIPDDGYGCYFKRMQAAGWDATIWCGAFCGSDECPSSLLQADAVRARMRSGAGRTGCGEEFRNCADIAILPGSGPAPGPSPTPTTAQTTTLSPATTEAPKTTTPAPATTAAPQSTTPAPATTAAPQTTTPVPATTESPATTASPTPAPAGSCVQNTDCAANVWCSNPDFQSWCPLHTAAECPSPHCIVASKGSTPAPTSTAPPTATTPAATTSEPEPEPEPTSTAPPTATTPAATTSEPEPEPEPEPTSTAPPTATTPAATTSEPEQEPEPEPEPTSCVSQSVLKCVNEYSTYWPKCDPSQAKNNAGPSGYEFGHYCTQEWTDALNEVLSLVGKCGDAEAIQKFLAQVAYETGYYSTVYQPQDGGAGLIHMIPGNWQINAQDMDALWPGSDYAATAAAMGKSFFQSAQYGWRSVAAWFKRTNRVIGGCGTDLFDQPYDEQTRCILSRVVSRQEAFDVVGRCMAEHPPAATTTVVTTTATTAQTTTPAPATTASPTPSPTTTTVVTTMATTAQSTTPAPATTASPTPSPVGGCVHNTDCSVNAWCEDPSYVTWCQDNGALGNCPAPMCKTADALMEVDSHAAAAVRKKGSGQQHGFLATALIQAGAALDRSVPASDLDEEL